MELCYQVPYPVRNFFLCRGVEIGIRNELKIRRLRACGFKSRPRHVFRNVAQLVEHAVWGREVRSSSLLIPIF